MKGVISRQVGLVVKAYASIMVSYTIVSVLTPLTPDEAMRRDNPSNSPKCKSRAGRISIMVI